MGTARIQCRFFLYHYRSLTTHHVIVAAILLLLILIEVVIDEASRLLALHVVARGLGRRCALLQLATFRLDQLLTLAREKVSSPKLILFRGCFLFILLFVSSIYRRDGSLAGH